MLAGVNPALDRPVILFKDIVEVLHRSMSAVPLQSSLGHDGWRITALWTDSTGATIDFLLWAKRDAAAAERFLAKALSGATHPAPRVINTDKHAGYSHLPLTRM